MSAVQTASSGEIAKDFLLAEHEHFSQLLRENEALGERRMQFFIGVVAAVIAAITTLATVEKGIFLNNPVAVVWVALGASLLLVVIGYLTYERLRKRDNTTDEYKQILDGIRDRFRATTDAKPPSLHGYDPFGGLNTKDRLGQLARMSAILTGLVAASVPIEIAYLSFRAQYRALEVVIALVAGFFVGRIYREPKPHR